MTNNTKAISKEGLDHLKKCNAQMRNNFHGRNSLYFPIELSCEAISKEGI